MSSLLLGTVLSDCTCWFHHMVTFPSWLVSTDIGTWSYQCLLSNFTPIFLHMLKCSWAHTLSCLLIYCSFANIGHMIWCVLSSHQIVYGVCICCLLLFVIFLFAWCLICIAWSCAGIISLSVSPFRSSLDCLRNLSSLLLSCLSIVPICWPCFTLLSHFFFKDSPNFAFVCCMPSFLCHCSHLIGLILLQPLLPP